VVVILEALFKLKILPTHLIKFKFCMSLPFANPCSWDPFNFVWKMCYSVRNGTRCLKNSLLIIIRTTEVCLHVMERRISNAKIESRSSHDVSC
jgi:hypothetical protein